VSPKQVWLFRLGCWVSMATAALHVAAYATTPRVTDPHAVVGLGMMPPGHVFLVPGLRQPSFMSVLDGLSLSLAIGVGTIGLAGFAVVKYGTESPRLMRGVSGAFGLGSALLLIVSIADFFSLQSFLIALMAMCFGMSAVNPEG
jgi:hypothetical protein